MPNKARRGKRKYSPLRKKNREKQAPVINNAGQTKNAPAPVLPPETNSHDSRARIPEPAKIPTTDNYPYVVDELKRIGILTGVILVIMIVLVIFLRHP